MLDFFMPRIYPELKINSEHGFWRQQAFYQPYSAPTDNSQVQRGVLTYHGKNQKAHSAPGHVIVFENQTDHLVKAVLVSYMALIVMRLIINRIH